MEVEKNLIVSNEEVKAVECEKIAHDLANCEIIELMFNYDKTEARLELEDINRTARSIGYSF